MTFNYLLLSLIDRKERERVIERAFRMERAKLIDGERDRER